MDLIKHQKKYNFKYKYSPKGINILSSIILLGISEEIHVGIDLGLVVSIAASCHNGIGLDLAQVARFVFVQIGSRSIRTQQFEIIIQRVSCPPLTTLTAGILKDRCVLNECHIATTFDQTTERSGMSIIVL